MSPRRATARALANVALVKYFGKRDLALNLPATGSLSVTLEPLETITNVEFNDTLEADVVKVGGEAAPDGFARRVSGFLDLVREMARCDLRARLSTVNSFPTAAGLASSASGFAAAALASTRALGLELDEISLSALARRGSGSAARSIPGGIVLWEEGTAPDGCDSIARSIASPSELDIAIVVGITDPRAKKTGSTDAMERTRTTSPLYRGWVESNRADLNLAVEAVEKRDLEQLGEIAERSALTMHAAAIAARPGIVMWNGTTVDALHLMRELRAGGTGVWFTCDAGPQPKAMCSWDDALSVSEKLSQLTGIIDIIRCRPGGGVTMI